MTAPDPRLLELIGDTHGLLDLEEFRLGVFDALRRAIPCDWISINEVPPVPGDDHWEIAEPELPAEAHETFGRYMHQNPLLLYMLESRNGTARRLSEMISTADYHALDLYRLLYGPLGLEHQIAFTLPQEPPRMLGIALSRRGAAGDFDDADRDLLNQARPYLIQSYRNAIAFQGLRASLGTEALLAALRTAGLTPREAEVMALLARGSSNADLAAELGISGRTAEKHVSNAFAKLGAKSRSEAAARIWGLVSPEAR
ncbi:MAG TPA: helix-turn-helix transcriptional regulator [Solirubrobacterales bacterium]|nr:helix-turn-helix transcriptional regulator [Solirubrobacterales bacterium]